MATGQDQLVGGSLLLISVSVFLYYSVWALFMPFVDEGHALHAYFLPREWAVRIPVALLLTALTGIFSFLALVMIKSASKKKAKAN